MNVNDLGKYGMVFVVLAIVLGIGGIVVSSVRTNTWETDCTGIGGWWNSSPEKCMNDSASINHEVYPASYNATTGGLDALLEMADWQVTLAIIIIASIIIGVIAAFWQRR